MHALTVAKNTKKARALWLYVFSLQNQSTVSVQFCRLKLYLTEVVVLTVYCFRYIRQKQKPRFYMFTAIYIRVPSAVCPLPWILNAPKPRPMGSPDRTAHDLCRPIRGLQDVTSLRRTRNHLFWLTMGLPPSTLQSLITQQILTQLQAYWA